MGPETRDGVRMKFVYGWAFPDADEFMANEIHEDGGYQNSHLRAALKHVTDFSVAIDGGAHVGTWSKPLSARFARVIALEPSADTFEALAVNLRAFNCENVEAKQVALGAKAGTVSMILDGRGALMHNTGARCVKPGGTVPLEAIDDWALPTLGFLKLDVEGSEYAALMGARETLTRCRPIVLYEHKGLCRRYGVHPDGPASVLRSVGYKELQIVSMDRIWGPA